MSRVARPEEKVAAIGAAYRALAAELKVPIEPLMQVTGSELPMESDPNAVEVSPGVWKHWGLYLRGSKGAGRVKATEAVVTTIVPVSDRVIATLIDCATRVAMGTDTRDLGILGTDTQPLDPAGIQLGLMMRPFLQPDPDICDDCGMPGGQHDPDVEH